MALRSSIEWTESTWNPVTGCTKISPGCKHCYAERMAKRLQAMGQKNYVRGFELAIHRDALETPMRWRKSRTVFVNSMSDIFHEEVPPWFIDQTFDVMRQAYWHRFQILTKRSKRLLELSPTLPWSPNIWMGVSIESKMFEFRADHLRRTGAAVKFLSLEPLLGPVLELNLQGIDWVIVGGESGPRSRPLDPTWVIGVRDQCLKEDVPFFFKQWGGVNKKKAGRELEDRTWDQMPGDWKTRPESAHTRPTLTL
ncbi:phage Gp37/Gp68 family protein [candidate division TA06 bacterium]|uniref:Phage Gp37/Gp68 family protein n=1 Tax=candidate division TA06 bacterium TaxID=2250710 RepID=A0A523US47_UNCT6|nr:MAG: phage Gp37/Gp68 family protein [candidate division TA06 bacterium]